MIKVNEYFKNEYLTCGKTRDNFIFENCPAELIKIAQKELSVHANSTKSCLITINSDTESQLEQIFDQCATDFQRKLLARAFFDSMFYHILIKSDPTMSKQKILIEQGIFSMLQGNFEKAKRFYSQSPTPLDIQEAVKKAGKVELNVFLINTKNRFLQQAANNHISARTPYSVKLFSTSKNLPTYADQNGNRIECPHDYISIKIDHYIEPISSANKQKDQT